MNIIIPLAGMSSFVDKNNFYPLMLREVSGKPLIQYVVENLLTIEGDNKFIYILKEEDCLKFHLDNTLKLLTPNCEVVVLKSKTFGAVCSVLMAVESVNKHDETIIVNADQVFNINLNSTINQLRDEKSDAGLITFESVHPRWSYIMCDKNNNVLQAEEKNPISRSAIAGFYYFKSFNDFIESAFEAIEIEDYYDNKLYTSALINQMILLNKKVTHKSIDSKNYISFYSPQKIIEFERYISNINTSK
jgi:dTDP-glucose pyrophosphorylase